MPTIAQLVAALEAIAPTRHAESWDNVGLLLGDPGESLRSQRVLLTIDLTPPVLDEAIALGVGAIMAYHPAIFAPIASITPGVAKGGMLVRAAREGIAIYSPHTALDAIDGGVNDWLLDCSVPGGADAIAERRAIKPHQRGGRAKLVFFAPAGSEHAIVDALSACGAGVIGNYSNCSFQSAGIGTFLGNERASPAIGSRGVYERVDEIRVEMLVPVDRITRAIELLLQHHPYEEPAFDVLMLHAPTDPRIGGGRIATLGSPASLRAIGEAVRMSLGVERIRIAAPHGWDHGTPTIRTIGVCPGSGGSLLSEPEAGPIQCFITGEMTHHNVLAALDRGTAVVLAGHTNTERGYLPIYGERIRERMRELEPIVSEADRWASEEL